MKTWQRGNHGSIIDLILASEELVILVVKCIVYTTKLRFDHRAIQTTFDVATLERVVKARLLFKNASWINIKAKITTTLRFVLFNGSI